MASASTPVNQKDKERDNFYRFCSLIVVNSKDAFINILELHLSNKKQSFEQFINNNRHGIYHLCFNKPCCKGVCKSQRKCVLQRSQLEWLFAKNGSALSAHRGDPEFCCCKAKPNIQSEVLDITLAYCLLINFCNDVFWYCFLDVIQPSITLEGFLNIHKHDIYHLKVGPRTCCQCPPGYISPDTDVPLKPSEWTFLFRGSGQPCNSRLHAPDSCCSVTATPGITTTSLINDLTTTLPKHVGEGRKDLDVLRDARNVLFAHLIEGALSDHEYQSAVSKIKKAILHIAKLCNKEKEAKDALDDLERRPLDHYSFIEHHNYLLQEAINFIELKESIGGLERVMEMLYHQLETQAHHTVLRDKPIRITEEEVISDNAPAETNIQITPRSTVTDLNDLIEVIKHDFSQANNGRHSTDFYAEVRRNMDNSGVFEPSDQSIENMLRYLPDGLTFHQKTGYNEAISALTKTLMYIVDVGMSVLSENELICLLNKVNIDDRNENMKKLRQKITTIMQDCRRSNFRRCMQYISAYSNLCKQWDIVVLYLISIFSINSDHLNSITNAYMGSIIRQRREDEETIQCLVQPQKETVIFALLYTPDEWLSVQTYLESHNMKSKNLDFLCSGNFQITSLAYKNSKVYMSTFGSCLRWAYGNKKCTDFKFRQTTEDGKTYFHIFPVEYPKCFVKMGMFSWWVRCQKGDPHGYNDGTWVIERLKYNGVECYVLCTKDSNGNCLTAGSTQRMHGKRGVINKRRMFLIHTSNSCNGDSNSQSRISHTAKNRNSVV